MSVFYYTSYWQFWWLENLPNKMFQPRCYSSKLLTQTCKGKKKLSKIYGRKLLTQICKEHTHTHTDMPIPWTFHQGHFQHLTVFFTIWQHSLSPLVQDKPKDPAIFSSTSFLCYLLFQPAAFTTVYFNCWNTENWLLAVNQIKHEIKCYNKQTFNRHCNKTWSCIKSTHQTHE